MLHHFGVDNDIKAFSAIPCDEIIDRTDLINTWPFKNINAQITLWT